VAHRAGEGRVSGGGGSGAGAVWVGGARQIWSAPVGHGEQLRRRAGGGGGARAALAGWARVCVRVRCGVGLGGDKEKFFFGK